MNTEGLKLLEYLNNLSLIQYLSQSVSLKVEKYIATIEEMNSNQKLNLTKLSTLKKAIFQNKKECYPLQKDQDLLTQYQLILEQGRETIRLYRFLKTVITEIKQEYEIETNDQLNDEVSYCIAEIEKLIDKVLDFSYFETVLD